MNQLIQNVRFQKVLKSVGDLKDVVDKKTSMYIGVGIAISIIGYKMLRKQSQDQQQIPEITEQEKPQSQNTDKSEENDVIDNMDEKQQVEKIPKQNEPKQKRKQIILKINQKTKRSFETDVEYPKPKITITKQNSTKVEKNQDDKLFFQIYQKMNYDEESNEDF